MPRRGDRFGRGERCSKLCLFPSRRGHRVGRLTRAVQNQSPIYSRLFRSKRYDSATNPNGLLEKRRYRARSCHLPGWQS